MLFFFLKRKMTIDEEGSFLEKKKTKTYKTNDQLRRHPSIVSTTTSSNHIIQKQQQQDSSSSATSFLTPTHHHPNGNSFRNPWPSAIQSTSSSSSLSSILQLPTLRISKIFKTDYDDGDYDDQSIRMKIRLLFDLIFSNRAGPNQFIGTRRFQSAPPFKLKNLPRINYCLRVCLKLLTADSYKQQEMGGWFEHLESNGFVSYEAWDGAAGEGPAESDPAE
ncbi:hypothetical protein PPACK8108_LOCUS14715 [Phakopsora pachyrhizi]|uniref:Uncharacterized protein n=1 Tax=Phakopsora pachyrhizi TaxID=170000 RepID=A0AAV0B8A0_PHAPC|nr:hypothetical protein PPACK8108_LOCUS14715 [Phakopsora pachyrhizi]